MLSSDQFSTDQIREIARHQRLRGVEVVGIKGAQGSVRIRVPASVTAPATAALPTAVPAAVASKATTVRSDRLGMVVLSGRPNLATPVQTGDAIDKGQVLALVVLGDEAGDIVAPVNGVVSAVHAQEGQRADYGMPMFELTPRQD